MKTQTLFLIILFFGTVIAGIIHDEFIGGFHKVHNKQAYPILKKYMSQNVVEWSGNWTIEHAYAQLVNGVNYHIEVENVDTGEQRDVYIFYQPWNHTLQGKHRVKEKDADPDRDAFSSV